MYKGPISHPLYTCPSVKKNCPEPAKGKRVVSGYIKRGRSSKLDAPDAFCSLREQSRHGQYTRLHSRGLSIAY